MNGRGSRGVVMKKQEGGELAKNNDNYWEDLICRVSVSGRGSKKIGKRDRDTYRAL